jgi:hypothetical protein
MTYEWGTKARIYSLSELKDKLQRYGYVSNLTAIAPFGVIIPLSFVRRLPIGIHRGLDNWFEGRPFFKGFGHDIFALVRIGKNPCQTLASYSGRLADREEEERGIE